MKLITIYFNIAISDEILEILTATGAKSYTQIPRVVGVGTVTGPRFDSHTWPGANSAIQTVVDEDTATNLMTELQKLRDSGLGKHAGIFAIQSPVEKTLI